jgi:ankyrin repeat protein
VGFSMGRPDVHLDRRVAENHQAIPRNNVRSTPSLDLSTLFDETSETKPMDPKTMAAVRAGKENYLRSNNSYISVAPTLVNDRGNTILHLAASSGHVSLVRYIIQKCPGLLLKSNMMGEVALHLAAEAGHLDVVWNLIDFINDISCTNLPVAKRIYFAKNKNQDTALHVALKGKHEVVASYLVSAAKSLSFVANRDGFSPLYLAIEAGHTSLVTTMCHGTNELSSKVGGRSIVHAALKANRKDILDALLSKDASLINLRDEGRTSLSFGASIGYYQGFSYLFDKNRDKVYVSDDDGLFPTHMAAKYGHVQILEEILKHCPEAIELLDRDGQNILHLAAKYGKLKVIKFILSCCKDKNKKKLINEQDVNGNTPLHLATINWHPKVVSMFTWDHRVDLKKRNYIGFTALDVAEENIDSSYIVHQRLTWMALINAGAPKSSTPITENLRSFKKPDGGKYKDRVNTLMLVATLVATMTFTAGFTLPGGYNDSFPHLGMAVLAKRTAFQVFLVCDTLAMYSSIITIVALIWAQLGDLSIILKAFNIALPFLGLALTSMSIAFMAGTYVAVSHLPLLGYFVLGIGIIFLLVLLLLLVPYVSPYAHAQPLLRHIFYYPYFLKLLAAGDNKNIVDVYTASDE